MPSSAYRSAFKHSKSFARLGAALLAFAAIGSLFLASSRRTTSAGPQARSAFAGAVADLSPTYQGEARATAAMSSGLAQPLSLVSEDFNADGVADVAAAYAAPGGGVLSVTLGNRAAFLRGPAGAGSLPAFQSTSKVFSLPAQPDFLAAGNFTRDGVPDLLVGTRGGNRLYILAGDGRGSFGTPQPISLPGTLTALVSGQIGVPDASKDLAVGVVTPNGPQVLVYKGALGGLLGQPLVFPVNGAATSLAIGNLDADLYADVAIVAQGSVYILHGQDWKTQNARGQAFNPSNSLESISLPLSAKAIALGNFIWDRDGKTDIAILAQDGTVQIATRGLVNTAPRTAAQIKAARVANFQASQGGLKKGLAIQSNPAWQLSGSETWTVAQKLAAPASGPNTGLIPVEMHTGGAGHGLLLFDPSSAQIHVLSGPAGTPTASQASLASGIWSDAPVTVKSGPVAAVSMRFGGYSKPGLVTLHSGQAALTVTAPPGDPTFTVNIATDSVDANPGDGVCADAAGHCSLRAAVMEADANTACATIGNCTINFSTALNGTPIQLTIPEAAPGDDPGADPSSGDLDINTNLIISGNGPTNTIIQGNFPVADGEDNKIFGINQDGTHDNLAVTIDNVTVEGGRNSVAFGDPTFADTGGGIDFFLTGTTAAYTLSNCLIANNTNVHAYGGGVNVDSGVVDSGGTLHSSHGSVAITNCTFSGNQTQNTTDLADSPGGALNLFADNHNVTITGSTFSGNSSVAAGGGIDISHSFGGTIAIHNSKVGGTSPFSSGCSDCGNSSGSEGGGIQAVTTGSQTVTIDQTSIVEQNIAGTLSSADATGSGGGINAAGNAGTSLSLSKVTILNNTISSNAATQLGGGGISWAGPGLTMSFSRIFGNSAGTGSGNGLRVDNGEAGSAAVSDNWWGCNSGPSASPCDDAVLAGAAAATPTLTFTPWLFLTLSANPTAITAGGTSALTADFLHDSSAGAVSASNIDVLLGLPITFSGTPGSIAPGAQLTVQANGEATATFQSDGTCASDTVSATVDNASPSQTITVNCPDLTAVKTDNVSGSVALGVGTWNWSIKAANSGAAIATFAAGQAILTDGLPTSNITYGTPTVSAPSGISGTGTVSCSIAGNTLSCTASGGTVVFANTSSFLVSFSATATAAGTYANPSGICAVDPNNVIAETNETNNSCSDTVTVVGPPTITKAFGAPNVNVGGTTSLTFTISNPNATALSGVAFSDTLTTGLTVAATPAVTNTCAGTVSAIASGGTISLTNGAIAAAGSCTISVNVTATTAGTKTNITGAVSSTNGGTGATSNTATLTVGTPPTISKAFGASTVPLNGTTTLSFTITNPNTTTSLSGIAFSDTLPAGLQVGATPGATNTCAGTLSAAANSGTVSLTGGTIAAAGSCAISVNITGTTAGLKTNVTGNVTATETGTAGAPSNTATITVVAPPAISKAFGATSIPVSGTTSLAFTLSNPNPGQGLTGVSFIDTFPSGLLLASTPVSSNTCGGTLTAAAGTGSVTLSGGTIAAAGNCSISVNVTSATPGTYVNTTGAVSSTEGGTGATSNTANLAVVAAPTISKAFGASNIALNGTTSLTVTISNANTSTALAGVAFSDTFPVGLVVAGTPAATDTCGGTFAATAGSGAISLTGGSVAASASCSVSVSVTATTSGTKTNITGPVSSTNGGTGATSNTATLSVGTPPTITKAFGAATIPLGGSTSVSFALANPNATTSLSGVSFTDTLPAGLVVSSVPNVTSTCGGTVTAAAGGGSITLTGGALAASGSCAISASVTGTTAGTKTNITGPISATETGAGATSNSAVITVVGPPTIAKVFAATSIPLNGTTTVMFSIANPNAVSLSGVAFSDTLPSGLVVAASNGLTSTCGGSAVASGGSISLSGGTLAASGSCAVSANVTGTSPGTKNNVTSAVSSTEGGAGAASNVATIVVVAPPSISKSFGAASIQLNTSTSLMFTITNPAANTVALTGVSFTDVLPAGLQVSTVPGATSTCGGTLTAAANSGSVSLSGGSIAAASSCSISVSVTGVANGTQVNTTGAVSSTNGGTGNTATASILVQSVPVITLQPTDQTVCVDHRVTFTAAATGVPTPTVQWQISFNGGANWINIPGATSTTLSFPALIPIDTTEYRAVFTNTFGSTDTNAATLTVDTPPEETIQPFDQIVSAGQNVTFTAAARGRPTPTVQWQVSTDGGATYTDIAGATSTALTFTATAAENGNRYRALFTNQCGSDATRGALLIVRTAPMITTQPTNETVCAGHTASFTAAASGGPSPSVQWQVSTNGGTNWSNISGANSPTLSFTAQTSQNGHEYRAVFTNSSGSATTNAATLTVDAAPQITTQPSNQFTTVGMVVTFTAAASGTPAPTVQWQVSANNGKTWTNISGATSTTLTFTATSAQDESLYRAVFTDPCGSATTQSARLDVD
jgi:CSLREA domain-containing protein